MMALKNISDFTLTSNVAPSISVGVLWIKEGVTFATNQFEIARKQITQFEEWNEGLFGVTMWTWSRIYIYIYNPYQANVGGPQPHWMVGAHKYVMKTFKLGLITEYPANSSTHQHSFAANCKYELLFIWIFPKWCQPTEPKCCTCHLQALLIVSPWKGLSTPPY